MQVTASSKATIAKIDGIATAAGCQLVASTDLSVATKVSDVYLFFVYIIVVIASFICTIQHKNAIFFSMILFYTQYDIRIWRRSFGDSDESHNFDPCVP